jgi:hypothetical protein
MSVRYSIDKSQRLIVTVAEGIVRFGDSRDHQNRLVADPDFDPTFDQLIDMTSTTRFELSADQARTLATRAVVSPDSRRAFIAAKPYIFGLGRMMEAYHEGLAHAHVFYSLNEALNWLESSIPVG